MAEAARQLAPAITLDDLFVDAGHADGLSEAQLATLLMRALTVVGALQAQVAKRSVFAAAHVGRQERLLDAADVSKRVGRSVRWIVDHMKILPPRRMVGGSPMWREADIDEWIRSRPRY